MERGFIIQVEAFDWNCPQHITPRYTESAVEQTIAPLIEENRALKAARSAVPAAGPSCPDRGRLASSAAGATRERADGGSALFDPPRFR